MASLSRALFVAALGLGSSACLLVVSTDGLAGDPLDATAEATPDVTSADAADAADASVDARDAFVLPDGSVTWSGNGHAYLIVVVPGGVSWTEARDGAVKMGGHLATIGGGSENDFVLNLANNHPEAFTSDGTGFWLGAYQQSGFETGDAGADKGWTWVDDTPWSFTAWQGGQPDNTNDTENYMDLYGQNGNYGWNDESLDGTASPLISYLVEFD